MSWDASRVAAAIPSGVGFLGAGLIWKGSVGTGDNEVHQVHGLTTAASVWLSAAVGVGAGGGLYFICVYAVALIIMVLRFGPRLYGSDDSSVNQSEAEETDWDTDSSAAIGTKKKPSSIDDLNPDSEDGGDNGNARFGVSYGSVDGNGDVGGEEGVSLLNEKGSTLSLLNEQGGGVKVMQDIKDGDRDGSGGWAGGGGAKRRKHKSKKKGSFGKVPSFSS
ncbi:hypothetical protein TL16_g00975 [Triparma laevis f. inornata]|nr:hypothetical protein TL16_g00975 [Triparma laevis f. inornata]